ncbi:hypothetical protein WICPIJ_007692 [Wickerhamomyces pijperi]|uniref:SWIM-type domain-containing protein n=1 Tax=Wickerhamomyces pijperi TaxID=599730 RepID=A0A9P8Q1X0_WICPI|nr:hypothetical protein WICPIJ_007692 [Wickerhamomyces pijperi]
MVDPWPLKECVMNPFSISNTMTDPSEPPNENKVDVGSAALRKTGDDSLWFLMNLDSCKLKIRNCCDCETTARNFPSGVNCKHVICSPSPSNLCNGSLVVKSVMTMSSSTAVAKMLPSDVSEAKAPPT